MAMVVAKQAMMDPRVQQLGMQIAGELGHYVSGALSKRARKRQNKKSKAAANNQLVVYNPAMQRAPVAYNRPVRSRRVRVQGIKGGVTIKHKEYIGEVTGNTTFSASSFTVQPGLAATFPWLSGIANNFEKYSIKNIQLHYINISATSERGRITLAYDKDALDSAPDNKVDMFSYSGVVEGAVWAPLNLDIKCNSGMLFTRQGTVTGSDLKTYDNGQIIVGVSNTADSTTVVGELFISYEIELTTPQPVSCPCADVDCITGITTTNMLGTAPVFKGNFPVTLTSSGSIIFDAPGYFAVTISVIGGSPGIISLATDTTTSNRAVFEVRDGTSGTRSIKGWIFYVDTPGQLITPNSAASSLSSILFEFNMSSSVQFHA
jgi:hypothetical protein